MNQINVNPPGSVESVDTSGDRSAAAGINLITVLIVLGVLAIIAWYLFTGPLRTIGAGGGTTNVNINPAPAPTTININPPSNNPPPSNSGGGGSDQPPSKP